MNFITRVSICLFLFFSTALMQVKNDMLSEETRITLNMAMDQKAQLLSKKTFLESAEHYKKALSIIKSDANRSSARSELEESIALLTVLNEDVEKSHQFFKDVLTSRETALNKSADRYSPYFWNLADKQFSDALGEYNDRDYDKATTFMMQAINSYNQAGYYSGKVNDLLYNWPPIKNADRNFAFLLSPENYSRGMEKYFSAIEMLSNGEEMNLINKEISESAKYFDQSRSTSISFVKTYPSAITARDNAKSASAEIYAANSWDAAEKVLKEAGNEFENKKNDSAGEKVNASIEKYKLSKQLAVKERLLFVPRQKIELARNNDAVKYAPDSFDNSEKNYFRAEKLIESDNYNESEMISIAEQANLEADKAYWISDVIKSVNNGESTWEDLILKWNVWESLHKKAEVIEKPKSELISPAVKPGKVPSKIIPDKSYLSRFPGIDMEIKEKGDNVQVIVYNIEFKPAGWNLSEAAKNVLNQLQTVLEDLNAQSYQITSYTDNVGAQRTNLEISNNRAKNIADYLSKNSRKLNGKLSSLGYGEVNPIASNSDFEGRMKNNRIEIIVSNQ